jgi:parvulin-like peptidyl-prolyl isomerase
VKRIWIFSLVPLILGLAFITCGNENKEEGKAVAKVNDQVLTEEDIERDIPFESKQRVTLDQRRDYVRRWVRNQLLYQEALRRKIDQEGDVKHGMEQIIKDFVVASFVEREFADSFLITPEEIKKHYQENKDEFIREEDEIRASHILLKTKEEAELVRSRLTLGENFTKLVKELSLDPDTKFRGGDLGYFTRLMGYPAIAEAAFNLKVGHFSKVIETEWGFHVIKVTDKKKKGTVRELWQVENYIANILSSQKRKEIIDRYIEKLKGKYKIEKYGWAAEDTT